MVRSIEEIKSGIGRIEQEIMEIIGPYAKGIVEADHGKK